MSTGECIKGVHLLGFRDDLHENKPGFAGVVVAALDAASKRLVRAEANDHLVQNNECLLAVT